MLKLYIQGRDLVSRLGKDESGASLAEYALLIALVLIGAAGVITALTTAIGGAFTDGTAELNARP
jgi:Flp pilus assembly pilin Flp